MAPAAPSSTGCRPVAGSLRGTTTTCQRAACTTITLTQSVTASSVLTGKSSQHGARCSLFTRGIARHSP
eukprot:scaffold36581_cov72-Phaeocystis_antarctica.AAC.6